MKSNPGEKGFTLIELVIVLIIMSIALGIVAPFVMTSFDKYRMRETSRGLSNYLRRAREVAINEGTRALIYYVADESAFRTVFQQQGRIVDMGFPVWFEMIDGVEVEVEVNDPFEGFQGEQPHFVFFPMGNAVGGTVKLSMGEERVSIVEIDDLTGGIYIMKDTGA